MEQLSDGVLRKLMDYAKIPKEFQKTEQSWVSALLNIDIKKNYFFVGKHSGSGKTMCACWWLRQNIINDYNKWHMFITEPDLLDEMIAGFDDHSSSAIMESYMNSNYLVLDELGITPITPNSEWKMEQLYRIIAKRQRDNMPTVFTSNLSLTELSNKLGERVASRINGMCQIVELSGEDLRSKYKQ